MLLVNVCVPVVVDDINNTRLHVNSEQRIDVN